jgi:cytoskeletal protein CcmA (bactofilin family)
MGLPASAAETASSEIVIIQPDDVVEDDLYAGSIRVLVQGEIRGDLVVAAVEEVVIEGTVTGTVTAVAPRILVDGTVGGSVRAAGGEVRIRGDVGGDLVAAAVSTHLEPGSIVSGDVLVWAGDLSTAGVIGEDLEGSQRALHLGGSIDGEVDVSVGTLIVSEGLQVHGDLAFRSESEGEGLADAEVGGSVVHRRPLAANIRVRAVGLFGRLILIMFLSVSALVAAYLFPRRTEAATAAVAKAPLACWLIGAALLLFPLVVTAVVVAVLAIAPPASALSLALVSLPLLLALFGLVLALCVPAGVPAVGRLGMILRRRSDLYGAVLLGSAVAGLLWLVPLLGWLVPLVVLPLGLGGWLRSASPTTAISDPAA